MIQVYPQVLHNQHLSYGAHQPVPLAVNMQYNGPPAVVPTHHQVQTTDNSGVPSREETVEEKRERKKQQLARRKVPEDLWDYYLKGPEHWNFDDVNEEGLQKGISAILIAPHTVAPSWVEKEAVNKFVDLKMKMTQVIQVVAEINSYNTGSTGKSEEKSHPCRCFRGGIY